MKKTLLASVTLASLVGFSTANAATVYEKDGFKLNLSGKVEGTLETTFGHHRGYNLKTISDATEEFKNKDLMNSVVYASATNYRQTSFEAKIGGDFSISPTYQINEGLKVFAGAKIKFTSAPDKFWTNEYVKANGTQIVIQKDDDGKNKKPKTASFLSFGGAKIGLGGTTILGKLTLGNQSDAVASYVGYYGLNKTYSKLASISYELGPVMGLNLMLGASLPLALEDIRPANLNPASTSGYTFGLRYSLELDKDMYVKAGLGYTTFTGNTKTRNPLNPATYANWKHEIGLGVAFETESMKLRLAYNFDFIPAHSNADKTVSLRTPSNHGIMFKFETGIMEGLTLSTDLRYEFSEAAMAKEGKISVIYVKHPVDATLKSKARLSSESDLKFKLGLEYEIAKGFTTGVEVATKTTFTSLPKNADGNTNKDDAINTVTEPSLNLSMGYKF